MGKKKFVAAVLNLKYETFIVHITSLLAVFFSSIMLNADVYPFCRPQIFGLIAEQVFTKVSAKYLTFADIFSLYLVSKLPKHTEINNHAIKLVNS